jgi:iron complex outermembrane receptor protein
VNRVRAACPGSEDIAESLESSMHTCKPTHGASLLALAVACACSAARAAEPHIEEILVTAPVHRSEAETALPVNVIATDELRRKLGANLGQTLKQEVGVTYSSFGPGVGQPVIRGQGAPRVLVLANSMPVTDASNTSKDHANATEPVLAERIEVLRGPATLLFGSGAIGGVVNVIDSRVPSRVPDGAEGAMEYRRADNADAEVLAGRLEAGTGNLAVHLDGFTRDNDLVEIPGTADIDGEGERGEIANSDAEASSGTAGASWVGSRGFVGLSFNRLDNDYGVPEGAHGHHHEEEGEAEDPAAEAGGDEEVRIDLDMSRYDLRAEVDDPLPGVERLRAYGVYTDYEHKELEGGAVGTVFTSKANDLRVEALHEMGPFHGAAGLQYGDRDFDATGDEAFVPSSTSRSWGVFVVEDLHADAVTWEFGVRYNRDEHDPQGGEALDFDTFSASVSAIRDIGDDHTVSFSLSRAQRAPATEELFSDGVHVATRSYELGNPALDEETSLNLDLGYHFHGDGFDLRLDAFVNRYSDYIYQQFTGSVFNPDIGMTEPVCTAEDEDECLPVLQWAADDADFHGVEAELDIELGAGFGLRLFGDYVRGRLDDAGDVPRMAPARVGSELHWEGGPWDLGVRLSEAFDQDDPGEDEEPTEGYTVLAAHAEYVVDGDSGEWVLFLRGDNLLDEEIRNATSLLRDLAPEAGRTVEAGIRLSF